jgi:Zn-dependent peptidase ImmA (M78 family)/transcriptional regulator with XRE-family HTH domain
MSPSIEALANPAVLRWAREASGYSVEDAASKVPVKVEKLAAWEAGECRPTFNQLREMANIYKRPLPVFFLPQPPIESTQKKDFRHQAGMAGLLDESPGLRLEIRKALNRREAALEVYSLLQHTPKTIAFSLEQSGNPEDKAPGIREWLGINQDQQYGWRDHYEALRTWRTALEDKGFLVFQARGIEVQEMRGFSITKQPLPVVAVNSKDDPKARIFSLMHELIHVLLNLGKVGEDVDLCDFGEAGNNATEVFCNALAGAIIVPLDALLAHPGVRDLDGTSVDDDLVSGISRRFKVSREVVLRRLLTHGLISQRFYQGRRAELLAEQPQAPKSKSVVIPPATIALGTLGEHYTRLVLEGFHNDKVSSRDLSDLLELRLPQVPKLETLLISRDLSWGEA